MKGRTVSFMYAINIVLQSLFSLLFCTGCFVGVAYLLVDRASVGSWVYIPMIILGLGLGIFSMLKFIIRAMVGLERLERQRERANKSSKKQGGTDGKN